MQRLDVIVAASHYPTTDKASGGRMTINWQVDRFSRRTLSEEQLSEEFPGYLRSEDGSGHFFDSPEGRKLQVGAEPGDQCFVSEKFGIINVSALLEYLDRKGAKPIQAALDQELKHHISLVEINPEWVRKISAARMKVPVLMLVAPDGMNILDGHHRLAKHIWNNAKGFSAFIAEPEALRAFQVRQFVQSPDGEWILQAGLDDDRCKRMVEIASAKWNPQNIVRGWV